ncbi:MAG TPA: MBL fold metallo-hydrolase [Gemmatimonadaceae bacterium]|nr:MBL fold metallo-hydrolase [Gemmatimonadaceae bacterium]
MTIGAPTLFAQAAYHGPAISLTKVADGVYATAFDNRTDAAMNGNGVVIVNASDVLVVDTQDTPEAARSVISEIRKITSNPVRYVINTHFHGDHHFGNQVYRDSFPGVEFISHPYTREDIYKEEIPALRAYADSGLENETLGLERALATGKAPDGSPISAAYRSSVGARISQNRWWLSQLRAVQPVPAGLTVADSLVLIRGERTIVVRFLGRGNTRGDLTVWLPRERVLITGDLLVNPMPYGFGSFLGDWIRVLDQLRALPARAIVPGHGVIQHDFAYLDLVKALLESTLSQARAAVAKGLDLQGTRKAVNLDSFRLRFTGGNPALVPVFDGNYTIPAVERAWMEARGAAPFIPTTTRPNPSLK